ncbi:MAG TPA: cytochrome c [Thermoanaerobaculia bacterium]|nr:cytochrome c [Thermoanaerobaculia bacterium]
MKTFRALALFAVTLLALALGFIYSGLFDVAASSPDIGAVRWVVTTVREHSVARRMKDVEVPPLADPALIRSGFLRYQESCVTCHGAPGVEASEIGQGLSPYPPELATVSEEGNPKELFWIVKYGIKMTGMPAFGVTHTDREIWATVAFLQKMPKMTPQEYQAMVEGAGAEEHQETGHP